jgi:GGDEF domain-containing protein
MGGDEFTILLSELDEEDDAMRIAERIQKNLKIPFDVCGSEIFMSASVGILLTK